jgi:hypothetical protein
VPEATSSDTWGEEELGGMADAPPQTQLPAKREADALPAGAKGARIEEEKGLEIGVKAVERGAAEARGPVPRLEVQEHVPRLLTPASVSAPVERMVVNQVIEKSAPDPDEEPGLGGRKAPEGDNWGKTKTFSFRWMFIFGGVLAVALIVAAIFLPKIQWKGQGERDMPSYYSQLKVQDNAPEEHATDDHSLLPGVEDTAKKVIHAYMTAKSPDDFLPFVRDRERVEPLIRARWKPGAVPADWQLPDESQWSINKTDAREFGLLEGFLPDVTRFRFFVVTQDKKTVLDWEASSGFCETPMEELSQGTGNGGVARGLIAPSDFYSATYVEKDYQCFRLTSLDGEAAVWVYAKRGTPQAEKIINLFVSGPIPREILPQYPVTVRLEKGPAEGNKNQWVAAEMLHIDWVTP